MGLVARQPGELAPSPGALLGRRTGHGHGHAAGRAEDRSRLRIVLAVLAGVSILTAGFARADPLASLVIAVLILPRSFVLLKDSAVVPLEIVPRGLDLDDVRSHLVGVPGVTDVHDLHAWTITSGIASLSAHVTVTDECLAQCGVGATLDELCGCVAEHFDVRHATFRVEPVSHRAHEDLGEVP